MTLFKYLFAILLTIPMFAIGRYLFVHYVDVITGAKQAKQEAKIKKRRESEKGFTIHIPDNIEPPADFAEQSRRGH